MKYKDVKTPIQLLKYMEENIKYGFVDNSGKQYTPVNMEEFQSACKTKYRLSTPKRLLEVKYGHCFEFVELERDWFKKHNYSFKTFYIMFVLPYDNSYSVHTYLVYESNEKFYYFEYANLLNRGIHEFASYEEAIKYQRIKHIEHNKQRNVVGEEELKHLKIYEYKNILYNCSMNDFINDILNNGKVVKF